MTNGSARNLKFYCPAHQIRFDAAGQRVVSCEQGGHPIGSGFPKESWWEFCCDCGTFWPADPTNGNLQRTECRVCERATAKRYLCTACQVVSLESNALVRRKTYSIDSESGIKPTCPGCDTKSNGQLREHDCAEINVRLLTSRSSCPFCENSLGPQASAKVEQPAPAAFRHCPFCGTQQKAGHRFCKSCGKAQPEAAQQTGAGAEAARREAEEAAAQKTADDRRKATAEALRFAEEKRRQEAKRLSEERAAQAARESAARKTNTVAAAIEAGKKAYQEEKRRTEEAGRQNEERQRLARELQHRAEEEAARRVTEEEARRVAEAAAERLRKEEAVRREAQQERLRVKEAQRQQEEHELRAAEDEAKRSAEAEAERLRKEEDAERERLRIAEAELLQEEHQRLAAELHRRAKEEEAGRAAEAESLQPGHQALTTTEKLVEPGPELEVVTQPVAIPVEETAQIDDPQPASDVGDDDAVVTAERIEDDASKLRAAREPDPDATPNDAGTSSIDGSFGSASPADTMEIVKAPEYTPSWHHPSAFTVPPPRRVQWVWIAGVLAVVTVGVMLAVMFLKARTSEDNANVSQPTPAPTAISIPVGMVLIPGGEFSLGSDRPNADQQEKPAHKATLAPFYIDTTEVTCEDYQKFVKATGHKAPAKWLDGSCPSDETRKPVTGVDWYDASAFAKWANKRLPTEEEWEFAARGTTGWIYPWGDHWRKGAANADKAAPGIVAVATFKETSPFHCYDMVGNAWEWTASKLVSYPGGKLGQQARDDLRVIRGGSWQSDRDSATATYRFGWPASGGRDYSNTSFRCARDVTPLEPAPVGSR